jgi:15-cis-phytoene desaturase
MENYDVTVIGGGISGLSTAALLSKEGFKCLVLEQLPIPGGRAHVVEKDGFKIDYGIHGIRFAAQGQCGQVLRKLGVKRRFLHAGAPLIFQAGKLIKFPQGPVGIFTTSLLSFSSKLKMMKVFITVMTRKDTAALYSVSVKQWLEENSIHDQDVHEMISLVCTAGLVCGDLSRVSTGELSDFLREAILVKEFTGYLLGGWDMLIEYLIRAIEDGGGELRTGTKVESIKIEHGVATGVFTAGGGEVRSRAVVLTVPAQKLGKFLQAEHLPGGALERAVRTEPTAGISIDMCLSKRVSDIDSVIFTMEPYTMGCFMSNIEPAIAPRGKQLGTWFYPIPLEKMADKDFVRNEQTRLKGIIENMFPGIRDHIEYERVIAMDIVDGAIPVVGQTWKERLAVDSPVVRGLFLAGDSVGVPGLGGNIAFNSALVAAPKIAEFLK